MDDFSLSDHQMSISMIDALEISTSSYGESRLGTCGILHGIICGDPTGAWDWVELKATFLTSDQAAALDCEEPLGRSNWHGVPLTAAAARGLTLAQQIASAYDINPVPPAIVALGLIADPANGATRALCADGKTTHRELIVLIQDVALGTQLVGLESILPDRGVAEHTASQNASSTSSTGAFSYQRGAKPHERERKRQAIAAVSARKPRSNVAPTVVKAARPPTNSRPSGAGFRIGTFIGAIIVSTFAGLPFVVALAFALMLQQGAARARKRHNHLSPMLEPVAALTLLAAIALALTGKAGFSEDVSALRDLRRARTAIADGHTALATRELGSASLHENQSVAINTLSACLDWTLGFKDYATSEAQLAINSGYSPGEDTTYNGRDCFLDVLPFSGLSTMQVSALPVLIFPLPDRIDTKGVQFLEIAARRRTTYPPEALVALACLADRYDFRMTASYLLTIGLGENAAENRGGLPSAILRQCLKSSSVRDHYKYFVDPRTGDTVYTPEDMASRIPTPSRQRPPAACWARFPASQPCNTDD